MSNGSLADAESLSHDAGGCEDNMGSSHLIGNPISEIDEVPTSNDISCRQIAVSLNDVSCGQIAVNSIGRDIYLKNNVSTWIARGYIDDSMLLYRVSIDNHEAKLLLDDGAASSFVDREYLISIGMFKDVNPAGKEININLANGIKTPCYGHIYLRMYRFYGEFVRKYGKVFRKYGEFVRKYVSA